MHAQGKRKESALGKLYTSTLAVPYVCAAYTYVRSSVVVAYKLVANVTHNGTQLLVHVIKFIHSSRRNVLKVSGDDDGWRHACTHERGVRASASLAIH